MKNIPLLVESKTYKSIKTNEGQIDLTIPRDCITQPLSKDMLGIWVGESEGANYWLGIMTELKNRGVQDIQLLRSMDSKDFRKIENPFSLDVKLNNVLYYPPNKKCH